ncbi:MAG: T9SS type A sorting domain-containing protein [Bacteroidetes bacterium]|nr:T9SS type A sorting domain-containing protein [Bacteroidota bacterium]
MIFFAGNNKGYKISPQQLSADNSQAVWTDINENEFVQKGSREIIPIRYRTIKADLNHLNTLLLRAPGENSVHTNYIFELPMPYGGMSKFSLTEYSMMEPALADKFPDIKTYSIKGIDDPYATGKLDITMHGFHAMILSARGDYFIDPYSKDENEIYISYFKKDFMTNKTFECSFDPEVNDNNPGPVKVNGEITSGTQLRTYRLACASTGEYTTYHGGTVALGLAAIVTTINRVNGVYEKDFSARMVLIGNNDLIVYTNSSTDPYTNNNGSTMLGQNQTTLDNVIGTANYDFGHVVSTGGGGVANLRVICVNGQKARGVTGSGAPIGDPFDIDYVAHEMGHQFGGNHSFNSTTSSCGGGNRNGSTAWEPGSASTIMGYAGICGSSNLQNNSDAYFHSGNFTEMASFIQYGSGSVCPVTTATGNTPPVVTVPAGGFTIPIRTPFALTGSATDAENQNSLTYCWEEMDLGPAGVPNNPTGNAPIFRSFKPDTVPTRTFPKLSNLLNNTQTIGELLPTYTRTLSFRLTVRDNSVAGGGNNYELTEFNVTETAGPFRVTQPDTTSVIWNTNIPQTVTWNVANTNTAPVNCQNVNIRLSTNGGNSYFYTLATNVPNDGSETVNLPSVNTSQARIKVESADNIFFDISNYNFTLTNVVSAGSNVNEFPDSYTLNQNYPNPFNPSTIINYQLPNSNQVTLKIYDVLGNEISTLVNQKQEAGSYSVEFDARQSVNGNVLSSGIYFYSLTAKGSNSEFVQTRKMFLIK